MIRLYISSRKWLLTFGEIPFFINQASLRRCPRFEKLPDERYSLASSACSLIRIRFSIADLPSSSEFDKTAEAERFCPVKIRVNSSDNLDFNWSEILIGSTITLPSEQNLIEFIPPKDAAY